jgi:NAD(P)-dependent dehydrogenase (short-subunit alcohol dehydrogenase family)
MPKSSLISPPLGGREAAVSEVKRRCGDVIDRLVACAGIAPDNPSLSRIASVNYLGVVVLLDELFESLKRGKNPAVVVISSNSAQMLKLDKDPYVMALLAHDESEARRMIEEAGDSALAYIGSKNAVARAVRRRAMTWGNAGVRLNAVAPGNTRTPLLRRMLDQPVYGGRISALPSPLGRDAEPDEIAAVVAFLLGPEASYIHGAVYYVDGGIDATVRPDGF